MSWSRCVSAASPLPSRASGPHASSRTDARMPGELTMPKLSDSMADAVIVRWLKAAGDAFERGEALIEVETDKATVVYEAESAGRIDSILAPEGATVGIGEPIATLGNGDASTQRSSSDGGAQRANATPVARRTAVELGVSLH